MSAATSTATKRVLVVDDQRAFAQSLEVVIDSQDDLVSLGVATTGEEAVERARADHPSVVLMDVGLPGIDGVEATKQILEHDPGVGVVVLTGVPDASVLARAASAGACAFLLKDSSVVEILEAVRTADQRGAMGVDSGAIAHLLESSETDADASLTQRELEVLGLLAQGRQPKQIAHSLGITVNTCRGYVKNVLAKLDAHSALEAVVEAHRRGLISLDGRS
jgi:DNA-binding NarL/FixJ family response regulator